MRKADFLVACVALAVLLISVFFSGNGKSARIYVDGEFYSEISLEKDMKTVIKSKYGENTVVVKDKSVYVESSDCKNGLCQKNAIKSAGQSIVCLPNRLSIIIEGNKRESEADILL